MDTPTHRNPMTLKPALMLELKSSNNGWYVDNVNKDPNDDSVWRETLSQIGRRRKLRSCCGTVSGDVRVDRSDCQITA